MCRRRRSCGPGLDQSRWQGQREIGNRWRAAGQAHDTLQRVPRFISRCDGAILGDHHDQAAARAAHHGQRLRLNQRRCRGHTNRQQKRHQHPADDGAGLFGTAAFVEGLGEHLGGEGGGDEVLAEVKLIVAEIGAKGPGDMGKVMGVVKTRLAGKAEMGTVSAAVKAALAG